MSSSTERKGSSAAEHGGVPQWKRELILRRRAVGRLLPAGIGSVQLTCPSVVTALRYPEHSSGSSSSELRRKTCGSERERTGGDPKNMRIIAVDEQVDTSDDVAATGLVACDLKKLLNSDVRSDFSVMGEVKNGGKRRNPEKRSPASGRKCEFSTNEEDSLSDSSEELKYGPGIVSKLKSRYLSLTLRESQGKSRPALPYMRRATSLENILDGPDPVKREESKPKYSKNTNGSANGNSYDRFRSASRGNRESMKRAGSVETLIRYEREGGNFRRPLRNVYDIYCPKSEQDDKEPRTGHGCTPLEDGELPPPDLVKHTLKIFENSNNLVKNSKTHRAKAASGELSENNSGKKPVIFPKPLVPNTNNVIRNGSAVKNFASGNADDNTDESFKVKSKKNQNETSNFIESPVGAKEGECGTDDADGKENSDEGTNRRPQQQHGQKRKTSSRTEARSEPGDSSDTGSVSPVPAKIHSPPPSLERNSNHPPSPANHMKQLGVVRPVITNKTSPRSGSSFSNPKYSANKCHSVFTEREIEKYLVNSANSIEQPVTKVIASLKKSPDECTTISAAKDPEENRRVKSSWDGNKSSTVVFNFSNRDTIPDYIENDGLVLASRKEKPKRGEPGIILLSGSTEDSSTDFEVEDGNSGPPSPCDFVFEGDNILINGKSNIQSKPKMRKMNIQFNDDATTMFEYPSEASLLDDEESAEPENESAVANGGGGIPALPNPFRCGNLASYTPSKVPLTNDFELGVTKTRPPPPVPSSSSETSRSPEPEEYLRPADDSSTVNWSSETATDLLF